VGDKQWNPSSEYRWYLDGSPASRIADQLATECGLYDAFDDPVQEAGAMSELIDLVREALGDPARGSRSDPGTAALDDEQLDKVRTWIAARIDQHARQLVSEQARAARPPVDEAPPPAVRALSRWHRHRWKERGRGEAFSAALHQNVTVIWQACACGDEREVVRQRTRLGERTIRIREMRR
jgi:hypothetical protein